LFTVMLACFSTDEQLSWNRLSGVLVGIAGLALMIGVEAFSGLELHVLAEGAVLLAAISYAAANVFGRRFKGQSPLSLQPEITASSVIVLPIAMLVDQPWTLPMLHPTTI
jgi:drug/metabolite transporter (DMT)-like permease